MTARGTSQAEGGTQCPVVHEVTSQSTGSSKLFHSVGFRVAPREGRHRQSISENGRHPQKLMARPGVRREQPDLPFDLPGLEHIVSVEVLDIRAR